MFTLTKEFIFEAAHSLPHLPDGHKCRNVHGHSYRVVVVVETPDLDARGFAGLDYAELSPFGDYLRDELDHRDLNAVFDFPTTAEHLARHLYGVAKALSPLVAEVVVSETVKTWVTYRGPVG
jgi:6-pyruvoyltetrahydropterin/6-carboxytetrahydropterin synthase